MLPNSISLIWSPKLIPRIRRLITAKVLVVLTMIMLISTLWICYRSAKRHRLCPLHPEHLEGRMSLDLEPRDWKTIDTKHLATESGGKYSPKHCQARSSVAFVIPYRERENHLKVLLNHLHPILQRQNLDYGIYVISQDDDNLFNRGLVKNIGFVEAMADKDWDCVVFHDVDLILEDDRAVFSCHEYPRHMSVAVDVFNYEIPYEWLIGGVFQISQRDFRVANGFSNQCWGWGAEDDDLYRRLKARNISVNRPVSEFARYRMLGHHKESKSPMSIEINEDGELYYNTDGLNNLKYVLRSKERKRLYTLVSVECLNFYPDNFQGKRDRKIKLIEQSYVTDPSLKRRINLNNNRMMPVKSNKNKKKKKKSSENRAP